MSKKQINQKNHQGSFIYSKVIDRLGFQRQIKKLKVNPKCLANKQVDDASRVHHYAGPDFTDQVFS